MLDLPAVGHAILILIRGGGVRGASDGPGAPQHRRDGTRAWGKGQHAAQFGLFETERGWIVIAHHRH